MREVSSVDMAIDMFMGAADMFTACAGAKVHPKNNAY
jgi:hypothetical protein